jgi:hypothetical protein
MGSGRTVTRVGGTSSRFTSTSSTLTGASAVPCFSRGGAGTFGRGFGAVLLSQEEERWRCRQPSLHWGSV